MNRDLLIEKIEKLKKRPAASAVAIDAIKDWLLQSSLLQRLRINPYYLAEYSGRDVAALRNTGVSGIQKHLEDLKGIDGRQIVYTAKIGMEGFISLVNILI